METDMVRGELGKYEGRQMTLPIRQVRALEQQHYSEFLITDIPRTKVGIEMNRLNVMNQIIFR